MIILFGFLVIIKVCASVALLVDMHRMTLSMNAAAARYAARGREL